MATLNEVMTQTADAIREKTGKSELIAPVNFAEEIKGITSGGGGGGGSDWHYFDVSALDMTDPTIGAYITMALMMVRYELAGKVGVGSAGQYAFASGFAGGNIKILAFGLDFTQSVIEGGVEMLYKGMIDEMKANGISLTEITKEQFYTLE